MASKAKINTGSYPKVCCSISHFNHRVDKQHVITLAATPPLNTQSAQYIDELYQDRKETLLSVDDLVKEVVSTLEVRVILSIHDHIYRIVCRVKGSSTIHTYSTTVTMVRCKYRSNTLS